jgi:prepilin-type N-terminal cleavage/methylation domain-containing protein
VSGAWLLREDGREGGRPRRDEGLTLIEVVVAMSIFAVASAIVLGLLVETTRVVGGNINRTTAANVAASQIESIRTSAASDIADGTTISTVTERGTVYTIKQVAKYSDAGSSTSVCAGSGSSLTYKLVTILVTWPKMGSIKPVRSDTLKAVSVGSGTSSLNSSNGALALQVSNAAGAALPNVAVNATSGSTTVAGKSDDDGCIVYTNLAVGSWTVTASVAGYSGTGNVQAASISGLTVTAGGLTRATLYYDTAASVAVTLDSPATAVVPATLPLRIGGTYLTEYGLSTCPTTVTASCTTGVPGTIKGLFPDNYTVKVGSCAESPSSSAVIDLRGATTTPSLVLPVGAPTVTVRNTVGQAVSARTITFTHTAQTTTGCTSGETYTATSSGTTTGTAVAIPYGTWTVSTTSKTTGIGALLTSTITLNPTNKAPAVSLVVIS